MITFSILYRNFAMTQGIFYKLFINYNRFPCRKKQHAQVLPFSIVIYGIRLNFSVTLFSSNQCIIQWFSGCFTICIIHSFYMSTIKCKHQDQTDDSFNQQKDKYCTHAHYACDQNCNDGWCNCIENVGNRIYTGKHTGKILSSPILCCYRYCKV